tara:strand:- start:136 stop:468 length:333 start_codon:yes stop_codon:yes gene_type:complete
LTLCIFRYLSLLLGGDNLLRGHLGWGGGGSGSGSGGGSRLRLNGGSGGAGRALGTSGTSGTVGTSGTWGTSGAYTTTSTTRRCINHLDKKLVKASFVKAGTLEFVLNFFA